jgi:hypothetical protein
MFRMLLTCCRCFLHNSLFITPTNGRHTRREASAEGGLRFEDGHTKSLAAIVSE